MGRRNHGTSGRCLVGKRHHLVPIVGWLAAAPQLNANDGEVAELLIGRVSDLSRLGCGLIRSRVIETMTNLRATLAVERVAGDYRDPGSNEKQDR